ncbi:hypothetical protein F4801DRAFT_553390 [Xylaria longipes]|nr:hypothetical protein F4801DRAFT_553390 [Xylaria longipes]
MSGLNFPQFSQLPFELRDAVWVRYALPRGPMLHSISNRYTEEDVLLCSFVSSGPGINLWMLPTTLALTQVSREARKAVLAGRQLQRVDTYKIDVFLGGVFNIRDRYKRRLMLHKFFFVNWDIDMFYFRHGLHTHMGRLLNWSFRSKMKRVAIDIIGPSIQGDALHAPSYHRLFNRMGITDLTDLPSLDTIYMVLDFHAVCQIYAHAQFRTGRESDGDEHSETHSVEQDEEDDSEAEEESDKNLELDAVIEVVEFVEISLSDGGFDSDDSDDYHDWLCELPDDQYGFHNVGPDTYHDLLSSLTCFFSPQWPLTRVEIPFQDWVDKMVSSMKEDVGQFCRRPLDIKMVMDLHGGICPIVDGYYRGYVGFSAVDEPVPACWQP